MKKLLLIYTCALLIPNQAACIDFNPDNGNTTCYIMTDEKKNVNAVRIKRLANNKISGELKYITFGQPAAAGQLEGTINGNIITADWTFIKNDTNFYRVPVSFKLTKDALYQKPSAVGKDGKAYIPKDAKYSYEFKKVECKYYPN